MRIVEHHGGSLGQEVQQAAPAAAAEQLQRAAADAVAGHLHTQVMLSLIMYSFRDLPNNYY